MRSFVALLALACLCEARPSVEIGAKASYAMTPYIIGGVEATPGEFPWQLSQERESSSVWSHSCGASLLSAGYALSAAHCVEGAQASVLRVWAGLHDLTDTSNGQLSNVVSFKMHEDYGSGVGTFPNDIAILTLETAIVENSNVQFAQLPADDTIDFAGRTCTMSGWGRTSESSTLPDLLQKADIGVITTAECNTLLAPVSGAEATDSHICLYDTANQIGSCNGDSGGPLNCNYPQETDTDVVVNGVTSWGISSSGNCLVTYPSVYTRTSAYLQWIADNTP